MLIHPAVLPVPKGRQAPTRGESRLAMKDERFGRSPDETDAARQSYAKGAVLLGADVDQGCEIARGKGIAKMLVTTNDYVGAPDLVAAAREFNRGEGRCVVSIWQILDAARQVRQPAPRVTEHLQGSGSDRDLMGRLTRKSGPQYGSDRVRLERKGVRSGPCHRIEGLLRDRFQIPPATKEEI